MGVVILHANKIIYQTHKTRDPEDAMNAAAVIIGAILRNERLVFVVV